MNKPARASPASIGYHRLQYEIPYATHALRPLQVSVIISVQDGAASRLRYLESIAAQDFASPRMIIVERAFADRTRELL